MIHVHETGAPENRRAIAAVANAKYFRRERLSRRHRQRLNV
jgi:hypothetical protein